MDVPLEGVISSYTDITLGNSVSGSISESSKTKYYRFTLSTSGTVTLNLNSKIKQFNINLYDAKGSKLWSDRPSVDSGTGQSENEYVLYLTSGTYYIGIEDYYSNYGQYSLKTAFSSANESFLETQGGSNNEITKASSISMGNSYNGQIALNDLKDFYKFTLSASGTVTLNLISKIEWTMIKLYDAEGKELWTDNSKVETALGQNKKTYVLHLTSGDYYIGVEGYQPKYTTKYYGEYTMNTSFSSANESFAETQGGTNNTIGTADVISLGNTYHGQIAMNDTVDFYKLTLRGAGTVTFSLQGTIYAVGLGLYDEKGNKLWETSNYSNSQGVLDKVHSKNMDAGTYYVKVSDYKYRYSDDFKGNYDLTIDSSDCAKVAVSSASARPGDTVTLTVAVNNNPGMAYLLVIPKYDKQYITLTDVSNGSVFGQFVWSSNALFYSSENSKANGTLCTFTFAVSEDAPETAYDISVQVVECYDEDEANLDVSVTSGQLTVASILSILYGDVNGDGTVDGRDVVRLCKYFANYNSTTGKSQVYDSKTGQMKDVEISSGADANGDGTVDGRDVIRLCKYLANYDSTTGASSVELGPKK